MVRLQDRQPVARRALLQVARVGGGGGGGDSNQILPEVTKSKAITDATACWTGTFNAPPDP